LGHQWGCVAFSTNISFRVERPVNPAYPKELNTLGDHLRKTRLDRGLSQSDVAMILGVDEDTITCRELNWNQPMVNQLPSIYSFLGYAPNEKEDPTLGFS